MANRTVRDGNVECFRCLCMLGIVLLHTTTWGPFVFRGVGNLGGAGVVGFVVISASWGIRFRPSKLLRIIAIALICAGASSVIKLFLGCEGGSRFYSWFTHYWYVWAYVFLMLFSPLIENAIERARCDRVKLVELALPISFVLWIWSYSLAINPISSFVPQTPGFAGCSGRTLLCIYILSRVLNCLGWAERLPVRWAGALCACSGCLVYWGFRHYDGVVVFLFVQSLFVCFKRVRIPDLCVKVSRWLAPSMFSVYLLHMPFQFYFSAWLSNLRRLMQLTPGCSVLLVAMIVFLACVVVDLPRRLAAKIIERELKAFYAYLDNAYMFAVRKIAER